MDCFHWSPTLYCTIFLLDNGFYIVHYEMRSYCDVYLVKMNLVECGCVLCPSLFSRNEKLETGEKIAGQTV